MGEVVITSLPNTKGGKYGRKNLNKVQKTQRKLDMTKKELERVRNTNTSKRQTNPYHHKGRGEEEAWIFKGGQATKAEEEEELPTTTNNDKDKDEASEKIHGVKTHPKNSDKILQ